MRMVIETELGGGVDLQGPALAGMPALAGLRAGFSRFGLFRENLRELFVDLGGNWKRKSSIPREIRGIGARKFVEM
jgi:hypothetical protein